MSVRLREKKASKGKNSLYLEFYKNGKRKYEFLKLYTRTRPRNEQEKNSNKEIRAQAERVRAKRELQISDDEFEIPQPKKVNTKDVYAFFGEQIEALNQKGKLGNQTLYKNTLNALKRFYGQKNSLAFNDIDYNFLTNFETYLFNRGCNEGGVSAYMRTLRAVINQAIKSGFMRPKDYPFSTPQKNGYSVSKLKSKPNPRALSMEDMEKVKNFPFDKYPDLKKSVLYFLFSYYARGMNFQDMARLQWSDIYNDRINYIRQKNRKFFSINLSDKLQEIIEQFPKSDSPYVFPILTNFHQTEVQKKNRIQKCLKHYNQDLKEIANVLGIDVNLTSYVARHTYATTLKNKGVDVSVISEGMGHKNVDVTKNYLKQFGNEVLDNTDELL